MFCSAAKDGLIKFKMFALAFLKCLCEKEKKNIKFIYIFLQNSFVEIFLWVSNISSLVYCSKLL